MTGRGMFAALAAVVVVAVGVWYFAIRDEDDSCDVGQPCLVDEQGLAEFAGSVGHEVYWAGARQDAQIELTNTEDGSIYVRYLPTDTDAGSPLPAFLTVGTYPVVDAVDRLEEAADGEGYESLELNDGGLAIYIQAQPSSIHFAYPDSNFEIEVFDPSPERALELVTEGEIQTVG